ncbi:uncharacterized protein BO95DRAFT_417611 [Aspergillus brunneoviolaceus CBS 621.78]|uniref:Uncharacterized protein n=1 Tax=Aspergillus brunneoviolaceus CBS 621.78 TaxID=1450534 RepID=A0ACD1G425_9EURO|nr:hypothetical protein BO95DRAFT_417611 [Aspergillus brunneoviolaceus CBS 621.78]RAH43908.1 hypothetical protein BO95DRAFT_417611 [Aspergillus brunneoviolaceus CBS 621.78]
MPPRRPISPLSFDSCSLPPPDSDLDTLAGSDDDLDPTERLARHRRIEKLAEAYLQGSPLFLLSASLRGPFDNGWVNPWRKDRCRHGGSEGTEDENQKRPVIPETNPRKRPLYHHESRDTQRSQPSTQHPETIPNLESGKDSTTGSSNKRARGNSRDIRVASATPKDTFVSKGHPSPHTNRGWLKKDCAGIGFRTVNPPTSPTATISSRRQGAKDNIIQVPATDYRWAVRDHRKDLDHLREDKRDVHRVPDSVKVPAFKEQRSSQSDPQGIFSDAANQEGSLYVLSSSSHLPKFEYRRAKTSGHGKQEANSTSAHQKQEDSPNKIDMAEDNDHQCHDNQPSHGASPEDAIRLDSPDPLAADEKSAPASQPQVTDEVQVTDAATSQVISSTERASSNFEHVAANVSDKLPSAQHNPLNPAITHNATSLHTISAAKAHTQSDEETIPDPQFNTQAALLHAQISFQKDLESPENTPGRAANPSSISRNDITPFCRVATPGGLENMPGNKAPGTMKGPVMSTQYLIDAVTPFTLSTEKRSKPRFLTPQYPESSTKPGRSSFEGALSSPIPDYANDESLNIESSQPPDHADLLDPTQGEDLEMTFSGTMPTTGEDGQGGAMGAESFNLNEAIAEAGSWLKESFDIGQEIKRCAHPNKKGSPSGTGRSAVSLDA